MLVLTLVVCGGLMIFFTMEYLDQVAHSDSLTAPETSNHIGLLLLVVTMMAGIPAVGMGAYVMYLGSRICATSQWPPAGMGYRTSTPVMLGRRANPIGLSVMLGGFILIGAGLSLPILGWQLVTTLSP